MKIKFEYTGGGKGLLEMKEGNSEDLFDAMRVFGTSIIRFSDNTNIPISLILLPLIVAASETEGGELDKSSHDLLVEMQTHLERISKKAEGEENGITNSKQ